MAVVRPNSDGGDDGLTGWSHTGTSSFFDAVDNYDDTKYWESATTGNQREHVGMNGLMDSAVNATTEFLNIRLCAPTGVLAAGSILAINAFSTTDGKTTNITNIDLTNVAKAPAAFTDFSIPWSANWTPSGSNTQDLRVTLVLGGGNTKKLRISHLSFGTAETSSTDYPQTGAASVTMSGSAARVVDHLKADAGSIAMTGSVAVVMSPSTPTSGTSVTVSGASTQGHIRFGMNSYFFLPSGATVGIDDNGNLFQGMGVKKTKG